MGTGVEPAITNAISEPSTALTTSPNESNIAQEVEAVKQKYQNTDKWLKAPNGEDSNLEEKQWLQVRTPSFKKWFGDWEKDPANASKVVDENGEPLVFYCGTDADFTIFDASKSRAGGRSTALRSQVLVRSLARYPPSGENPRSHKIRRHPPKSPLRHPATPRLPARAAVLFPARKRQNSRFSPENAYKNAK